MKRDIIIRAVFVVVWIGLAAFLFVHGRGHGLLIDNAGTEDLPAPGNISVTVNNGKPLSFTPGDRDRFSVGSSVKIKIEAGKRGFGASSSPAVDGLPFETTLKLPFRPDTFILSIPRLLAGRDDALGVFEFVPEPHEEPAVTEETTGGY